MKLIIGLTLTLTATALAALLGWNRASQALEPRQGPGDRVMAAVEGLRESHLYVAPDSEHLLTEQDRARIEREAAATRPATYVIVWADTSDGGYRGFLDPMTQIASELDQPGRYIVVEGDNIWDHDVGIEGDYVSSENFDEDEERTPAALAAKLSATIAAGDDRDYSSQSLTHSDYWGGTAGAIGAGALMGTGAGLGLALVLTPIWFIVRARTRRR
ncbi:hypothetical protein [Aeromicrobium sp. P5_D10]